MSYDPELLLQTQTLITELRGMGLTKGKIAQGIDVSYTTINNWLDGKNPRDSHKIEALTKLRDERKAHIDRFNGKPV